MPTTWSTTDKNQCTLSGGDLVASFASNGAVRSLDRVYTGKYYWEVTFTTLLNVSVGVSTAAAPLNSTMSSGTATSFSFFVTNSGAAYAPTIIGNIGGTFPAGWVLCIALDAAGMVWFRNGAAGLWNGNAANNPTTGVGGFNMAASFGGGPAFGLYASACGGGGGGACTANFGATAFVGAVPVGFTSGFPSGTTLITSAVGTQTSVEHWVTANPAAQVTQVAVEQWASINSANLQALVTQVVLEHWSSVASVPIASGGPIITMIY